jgi:hypothetical protein
LKILLLPGNTSKASEHRKRLKTPRERREEFPVFTMQFIRESVNRRFKLLIKDNVFSGFI